MTQNNIVIKIDDGGELAKLIAQSAIFKNNLDSAAKSMPKAAAAARAAAQQEGREYGKTRGAVGTGAAGRDFAKQAQGLGGLVHLYATFAANIFAVTAAFSALQRAADTANLVKGLDQLGAASGRGLGQLSKDVVKATDNAVSLREAMTAVAQASSAGMNDTDIKRMAEGAKKASQALGVDMADALSRISRGITKLEPELLDEIGIFVRVDKAAQDYAKSVGKPVSALTDLEKRAAFANAALNQVEQKFGEINIDSNPYTQLAAQFKNVADSGLNMVNYALGPVVKLLGSSPTALAAALALVTTKLVGQAIPAIGQYREGLKAAAEQAKITAESRASKSLDIRKQGLDSYADAKVSQAMQAEKAFDEAFAKSRGKYIKEARALMADKNLPIYEKDSESAKQLIATLDKAYASAKRGKEEILAMKKAAISAQQAHDDYANKPLERGSAAWVAEKEAKRASSQSARSTAIANASENAAIGGIRFAYTELGKEIAANTGKISAMDKVMALVGGTMSAVTTRVIGLGSALMGVFGWVGAIVAIGSTLLNFFSTNEKQAAKFADALTTADNAADTLVNTIDRLSKSKNLEQFLSPESVIARANALDSLATSLDGIVSSFDKVVENRSWSNSTTNWLADFFGNSDEDQLAKVLSQQIQAALKAAASDPKLKQLAAKLSPLAAKGKDLTREDASQFQAIMKESQEYKNYSNVLLENENHVKALAKANLDLQNTYKNNTPLANQLNAITAVSVANIRMIDSGEATITTLQGMRNGLEGLKNSGIANIDVINDLVGKINGIDINRLKTYEDSLKVQEAILRRNPGDTDAQAEVKVLSSLILNIKSAMAKVSVDVRAQFTTAFIKSVDVLSAEMDKAFSKARTISATAQLGYYGSDSEAKIKREAEIKIAEIKAIEGAAAAADVFANSTYAAAMAADKLAVAGKRTDAGATTGFFEELEAALNGKGAVKGLQKMLTEPRNLGDSERLAAIQKYIGFAQQKDMARARSATAKAEMGAVSTGANIAAGDLRNKKVAEEIFNAKKRTYDTEVASLEKQKSTGGLLESEYAARKAALEITIAEAEADRARADILRDIEKAKKIEGPDRAKELAAAYTKMQELEDNLNTKKGVIGTNAATGVGTAQQAEALARVTVERNTQLTLAEAAYEIELRSIDAAKASLDLQNSQGLLLIDEYNQSSAILQIKKAELEEQKQINAAMNEYLSKTAADRAIAEANPGTQAAEDALGRINLATADLNKTTAAIHGVKNATVDAAKGLTSMTDNAMKFKQFGMQAMQDFSDSVVDAALTGKWEFTDMVNSMLAGLAKLILQQQTMKWMMTMSTGFGGMFEDGGSFTGGGVQAFAKGGTFTNQVVNSPTLFKFAKGTGLMGEAGPEAIMPLSRDSSGKLGVSANIGGSETVVVVNNYSSEKATAKESKDAKGNRRVEVTIGDMVASEIGRPGSSTNAAMAGTFGTRPQLVRR